MSQFGQAAGLIQQNKQAELGRAEDRRRDNQSMMATLLTLFMQGKISREEMDARLQMARENNASAERINAATLQTNRDLAQQSAQLARENNASAERINAATLQTNRDLAQQSTQLAREGLGQRKAEFDAEYKFKQAMVQNLMVDRWSTGLQAALKDLPNQQLGEAEAASAMFADKIAKAEAAKGFFVQAADAKENMYKTAGQVEANQRKEGQEMAALAPLGAAAGQQGVNVAKTVVDGNYDVGTPQGMTAALTTSGLLQSKAGPDMLKAATLLQKQANGEGSPDDVATLRRLFMGDGKTPGMGPKAMTTLAEMFHSAGTTLLEEARSTADMAVDTAGSAADIQAAGARGEAMRVQASKFLKYSNTLRAIEPVNANLITYTAAKNQWYQKLMQAPPGKLFNSDVFWDAYSQAIGPGVTPEERVQIAQGIAAAEEQAFGVARPVQDWVDKISRGAEAASTLPPDVQASAQTVGIDQLRLAQAEVLDHLHKVRALSNYDQLTQYVQTNSAMWAQMPPDIQKQMAQAVQPRLQAAEAELKKLGVVPGQVIAPVNPAKLLLEADANAKAAKEKALGAARLQAAKQALGTPRPIAAPDPNAQGLPPGATQVPQQAPATARPAVSPGLQQLRSQVHAQQHPMPTADMPVLPGYALPGQVDDFSFGEALINPDLLLGAHDMGSMK